uniref:Uncharacterized protein n=1 Tax=Anguilla anguilla TaxID=7936 RepID=A0A0E9VY88_ANGAN
MSPNPLKMRSVASFMLP